MSNSNSILDPSDATYLMSRSLTTPSQEGKRSIRRSLMTSDESVASVDSAIGMGEFVEIPTELQSVQTLEYIGYDGPTARSIWQSWIAPTVYDKGTFLNFATRYIQTGCNHIADTTANNGDKWSSVMSACGINRDTQSRIMQPQHQDVRLTRSAKHWIVNTIQIRFGALKETQENSKSRTQRRNAMSSASTGGSSLPSRRNRMMSSGGSFQDVPMPSLSAAQTANLPEIPGYTTLYRGDAKSNVAVVNSTNKIDLSSLIDENPSDFSGNRVGDTIYFGSTYWVGEKYAKYLKHRQDIGTVVILKMVIPNNWLERVLKHIFTYGDDWKHVVFNSRKACSILNLPYGFSSISSKAIIIGPIMKTHTTGVEQMSDISQITEQNLIKHPATGELGIQNAIRFAEMENLQDVAVTEVISSMT